VCFVLLALAFVGIATPKKTKKLPLPADLLEKFKKYEIREKQTRKADS
jgi:hypothetical protein